MAAIGGIIVECDCGKTLTLFLFANVEKDHPGRVAQDANMCSCGAGFEVVYEKRATLIPGDNLAINSYHVDKAAYEREYMIIRGKN